MVVLLPILALCLVGAVGTIIAVARDPRRPTPTVWSYDTRRPQG